MEIMIELTEYELDAISGGVGSVTFSSSNTASGTTATISGTVATSTTASSASLSVQLANSSAWSLQRFDGSGADHPRRFHDTSECGRRESYAFVPNWCCHGGARGHVWRSPMHGLGDNGCSAPRLQASPAQPSSGHDW